MLTSFQLFLAMQVRCDHAGTRLCSQF